MKNRLFIVFCWLNCCAKPIYISDYVFRETNRKSVIKIEAFVSLWIHFVRLFIPMKSRSNTISIWFQFCKSDFVLISSQRLEQLSTRHVTRSPCIPSQSVKWMRRIYSFDRLRLSFLHGRLFIGNINRNVIRYLSLWILYPISNGENIHRCSRPHGSLSLLETQHNTNKWCCRTCLLIQYA